MAAAVASVVVCAGTSARAANPRRDARSAAAISVTGVTRHTIVVAGLLAGNGSSAGADLGARARFRRANRHGGVAGRTIRYLGTEVDGADPVKDAGAIQKLSSEVFAVVPAVSSALDTAALARAGVPFFGAADSIGWDANRFGFGFAGAQASLTTRVVNPAWGVQLRSVLGGAQGNRVVIATDDGALGTARAEQARVALRAAGFRPDATVTLPSPRPPSSPPASAPESAAPDFAALGKRLAKGSPAAVLLLTSPGSTAALAKQLAVVGYTGTVATSPEFYQPTLPSLAEGLTVLVPYAPFEQTTAANRRLAADVKAFAPGSRLTPALAAGYWAADQFLAALGRVGRELTVKRLLAVTNGGFKYGVADTVGTSTWPAMHTRPIPCGALVQSDGSRYYVVAPYRCAAPIAHKGASVKRRRYPAP
jgi:ABC-type branched-subunit amino acid transport system substrate-binding protein